MFASSSFNLQTLRSTPSSVIPEPKPKNPRPSTISLHTKAEAPYESNSEPQVRKFKCSPQLKRWSRARSIRSGRKLDRPGHRSQVMELDPQTPPRDSADLEPSSVAGINGDTDVEVTTATGSKSIYMISDGTGWTAEHSVNAALGQFEHCLVDRGCPVHTHLFSGVKL